MSQYNKSAQSAPQQIANGAYRAVDMLTLMASKLDRISGLPHRNEK